MLVNGHSPNGHSVESEPLPLGDGDAVSLETEHADRMAQEHVSASAAVDSETPALGCPVDLEDSTPDREPSSDLELGLMDLLAMLKTWSPYLQQLSARQDEILALLSQPIPVTEPQAVDEPLATLDPTFMPRPQAECPGSDWALRVVLLPFTWEANLKRYNHAADGALSLLAERLAESEAEPRATANEWRYWALVEVLKHDIKDEIASHLESLKVLKYDIHDEVFNHLDDCFRADVLEGMF